MTSSLTNAQEGRNFNTIISSSRFNLDEPISFTERGIEFFVFTNGDFDFNTRPNDSQGDYFFKSAGKKRANIAASRGAINYGTLIEHDSFGRVRRVGNTFINYDSRDRVSRIGTVYMKYNRFALTQIGGMTLVYNRIGAIVDVFGSVKSRQTYGFTSNYYETAYNHNYHNSNNYYTYNDYNDDDYIFYKADGTKAKIETKK